MSDLAELFARDPLSYTKEGGEVRQIVAKLRESHRQFNLGSAKAGSLKKPTTARQKAVAKISTLNISSNLQALLNKGKSGD